MCILIIYMVILSHVVFVSQKAELVAAYKVEIASLIGASSLELQAEAPTDSAAYTPIAVDDTTFLFMRILGMVDFTAQLAKMNREIEQASNRIGLLRLKMSGEGYTKAPEAVRSAQAEKVGGRVCGWMAKCLGLLIWFCLLRAAGGVRERAGCTDSDKGPSAETVAESVSVIRIQQLEE